MATSFAAYASQYLTKHSSDTLSSSQPLFFSFTTDDADGARRHEMDLDDMDDPHLHLHEEEEELDTREQRRHHVNEQSDDDPYLKLDESPPGWLAHLSHSPRPIVSRTRSPSPSSASDSPPPELLAARNKPSHQSKPPSHPPPHSTRARARSPSPSPSLGPNQLTESLLPRAGLDEFSLPDPRHSRGRRRHHNDAIWTSLWLASGSGAVVLCIVLLVTTNRPKNFPAAFLPYAILLRTVPILTILTMLSAAAAYAHVWLLRVFAGPVMWGTSVFVPATLAISAVWAFVGSFMWEEGVEPTWGETVGLRLFAIIPLVLAIVTGRRLLHLPRHIHRTSTTLSLSTQMLLVHPFLAALSPALLLAMLLASIPFLTAVFRLLLIGYGTQVAQKGWEWHVRAWANWGIVGVLAIWLWSWAVARGLLRMVAAGVIGSWYFSDPTLPPPPPNSTHSIHAALMRASGPSLGTLCISALLLTLLRFLTLILLALDRLPSLLLAAPLASYGAPTAGAALAGGVARWVVPAVGWVHGYVDGWKARVSRYVLVYCGMTGAGFWEGAGRAGALVSGKEIPEARINEEDEPAPVGRGKSQRTGRNVRTENNRSQRNRRAGVDFGAEPSLALLTIAPLTLTLPFSLMTYLFVAHTLNAPHEALGAALLAAGTTGMVGVFCVGLVRDCADTLYLCYCIDKAHGKRPRDEVLLAFEYDGTVDPDPATLGTLPGSVVLPMHRQHVPGMTGGPPGAGPSASAPRNIRRGRPMPIPTYPETIIPRSPLDAQGSIRPVSRHETLFDARAGAEGYDVSGDEESSDERGQQDRQREQSRRHGKTAHRGQTQHGYEDSEDSVDGNPRISTARQHGQLHEDDNDDDDEMNPFKQSGHEDMFNSPNHGAGTVAGASTPRQTVAGGSAGTSPRGPGFGFVATAHAFNARGGVLGMGNAGSPLSNPNARNSPVPASVPQSQKRMMSSTQELNMKSQFLMNMRAFGAESEASASGSGHLEQSGTSTTSTASAVPLGASSVAALRRSEAQSGPHGSATASGYEGYMEDAGSHEADAPGPEHADEPPSERSDGEESMLGPGSGFFK